MRANGVLTLSAAALLLAGCTTIGNLTGGMFESSSEDATETATAPITSEPPVAGSLPVPIPVPNPLTAKPATVAPAVAEPVTPKLAAAEHVVAEPVAAGESIQIAKSGMPAYITVEYVAAACWMNNIVRGGAMLGDRIKREVTIASEEKDLLIARVRSMGDGTSIVTLTGPVSEDPAKVKRLSETLAHSISTGDPHC